MERSYYVSHILSPYTTKNVINNFRILCSTRHTRKITINFMISFYTKHSRNSSSSELMQLNLTHSEHHNNNVFCFMRIRIILVIYTCLLYLYRYSLYAIVTTEPKYHSCDRIYACTSQAHRFASKPTSTASFDRFDSNEWAIIKDFAFLRQRFGRQSGLF